MTPLVQWLLNAIPYVLQLAVGAVGLIITLSTRRHGRGTGLLVTAFVLMMVDYLSWLIWSWLEYHAPSLIADNNLSISTWQAITTAGNVALGTVEVVAWLLVALGILVARSRKPEPPQRLGAPAPFSPPPPGAAGPA